MAGEGSSRGRAGRSQEEKVGLQVPRCLKSTDCPELLWTWITAPAASVPRLRGDLPATPNSACSLVPAKRLQGPGTVSRPLGSYSRDQKLAHLAWC